MTEVNLESVRAHVEILRWAVAKRKEIKELEAKARDAIEAVMKPGQIGLLDGEPVINWSEYKSNTFDQAAFGEEHPELLAQYKSLKTKTKFDVL